MFFRIFFVTSGENRSIFYFSKASFFQIDYRLSEISRKSRFYREQVLRFSRRQVCEINSSQLRGIYYIYGRIKFFQLASKIRKLKVVFFGKIGFFRRKSFFVQSFFSPIILALLYKVLVFYLKRYIFVFKVLNLDKIFSFFYGLVFNFCLQLRNKRLIVFIFLRELFKRLYQFKKSYFEFLYLLQHIYN